MLRRLRDRPGRAPLELVQARGILPQAEAAELILQAAAGLQEIHRVGLLHGNLSPETILVTPTASGRPLVKLIRLGFVQNGAESAGDHAGIRYAAPERLAGETLDQRSDVFSLGAVLHHLLAGTPPDAASGGSTRSPLPSGPSSGRRSIRCPSVATRRRRHSRGSSPRRSRGGEAGPEFWADLPAPAAWSPQV